MVIDHSQAALDITTSLPWIVHHINIASGSEVYGAWLSTNVLPDGTAFSDEKEVLTALDAAVDIGSKANTRWENTDPGILRANTICWRNLSIAMLFSSSSKSRPAYDVRSPGS